MVDIEKEKIDELIISVNRLADALDTVDEKFVTRREFQENQNNRTLQIQDLKEKTEGIDKRVWGILVTTIALTATIIGAILIHA